MGNNLHRIMGREYIVVTGFISGIWLAAMFHVNSPLFNMIYSFFINFDIVPGDGYYMVISFLIICLWTILLLTMVWIGGIKGLATMAMTFSASWYFPENIWISLIVLGIAAVIAVFSIKTRICRENFGHY